MREGKEKRRSKGEEVSGLTAAEAAVVAAAVVVLAALGVAVALVLGVVRLVAAALTGGGSV